MDYERLRRELVRSLRAQEKQEKLSRDLGFRANQLYRWESGLVGVSWLDFAKLGELVEAPILRTLRAEIGYRGKLEDYPKLLKLLVLDQEAATLARITGVTPGVSRRWLRGETCPSLEVVLQLLDVNRVLFRVVRGWLKGSLPPVAKQELEAQRLEKSLSEKHPYAMIAIALLETEKIRTLPSHRPGFLAKILGITEQQESDMLKLAIAAGRIEKKNRQYRMIRVQRNSTGEFKDLVPLIQFMNRWNSQAVARYSQQPDDAVFRGGVLVCSQNTYDELYEECQKFLARVFRLLDSKPPDEREVCAAMNLSFTRIE